MLSYQEFIHLDAPKLEKSLGMERCNKKLPPKEYLQAASWPTLFRYCLEEWFMIISCWIGMKFTSIYLYPIFALVLSGRFHALGVLLHEACHLRRSGGYWAYLVEILAGYPIASTIEAMRYHHLRHHLDTSKKTDPYFKSGIEKNKFLRFFMYLRAFLLVPFWMTRPLVGVMAYFFARPRNFYGHVFLQDKSKNDLRQSRNIKQCSSHEFGQLGFQIILLGVAIFFPKEFLYGYFLPVLIAAFTNGHRVIVEHFHEEIPNRKPKTIWNNTRDHGHNPLVRFLFFPRNIGYHRAHHLFPGARQENLPKLTEWYQQFGSNL